MAGSEADVFTTKTAEKLVRRFIDNNGLELCSEIMLKLQRCINKGQNSVQQIELLIKEINSLHKRMAATKFGGSAVALGGIGGMAFGVIGGAVTFFTGGVGALPLAVMGVGLLSTASGAGITAASDFHEEKLITKKVQRVEKYLLKYQEAVQELKQSWEHVGELCEKISIEESLDTKDDMTYLNLLSYFWGCFIEALPDLSCDEARTAFGNIVREPIATIKLFFDVIKYIYFTLPYAINQLINSFGVLFQNKQLQIVEEIKTNQLSTIKDQINRLKIAKNGFARAKQ